MNSQNLTTAEELLRRIAALPAPSGLEERIQARLAVAPLPAPRRSFLSGWLGIWEFDWMQSGALRAAAAVAIAAVVLGGGWGVARQAAPTAMQGSTRPGLPVQLSAPPAGGFSTAGAVRVPQTLDRPVVEIAKPKAAAAQIATPQTHKLAKTQNRGSNDK